MLYYLQYVIYTTLLIVVFHFIIVSSLTVAYYSAFAQMRIKQYCHN